MSIFVKTFNDERNIINFISKTNKIIDLITPYSDCCDISELIKLKEHFIKSTDDFLNNERKLNIGVIGQVKAGKSSFLNTLLFDGKKVLPSAATPKTATLTKIEYGKDNFLIIEYYDKDEWSEIEKNAKKDSNNSDCESAREIIKLATKKCIKPLDYISRKYDKFGFSSSDELMNRLDAYVGEEGKYTAVVKNVTIRLDMEDLKDISIVDTPGLNDIIVSRTARTRQFLSECDVVFFLSRASQFLDSSDMKLITTQLPQKGAEKLVFICSRFDDGLTDTIYDCDSIEEAIVSTKASLKQRASKIICEYISKNSAYENTIGACKNPVFISSMCWNMRNKSEEEYDRNESKVFENLNENDNIDSDILRVIGNIDAVRKEFDIVIKEKDATLSGKAGNFIPKAESELKRILDNLILHAKKKSDILRTSSKNELEDKRKYMSSQINSIKSSVEVVFGETLTKLETAKISKVRQLREIKADAAKLPDKTAMETHVSTYRVSDSKWYKPSTWGTSHMSISTYQTEYQYVDVSDAIENIRNFSYEACSSIEETICSSVDLAGTKYKLLNTIIESIDISDDRYDPALFRMLVDQTINTFEQPVLKLDVSEQIEVISSYFNGQVCDNVERVKLRNLVSQSLDVLLTMIMSIFENEVLAFHNNISSMKNDFTNKLLKNIEQEFNELLFQIENKEKEIQKYEDLLVCLDMAEKK